MELLFIGGTGLISTACVELAVAQGHDVTLLNRGRTHNVPLPEGVRTVVADAHDKDAVRQAISGRQFDAVVDWIAFTADDVARDIELFSDAGQYVFISSASAYETPPSSYLISERTPLSNPFWQYSRDKIAAEETVQRAGEESGLRYTIVRPSHTYGVSQIPLAVNTWQKPYTAVDRMRHGRPVIIPGDGTSLWVLTHNSDFAKGFVGLLGNERALGEAVHITSDEVLSWNQIYQQLAGVLGVELNAVHVPTAALAAADPEFEGSMWGDKSNSVVFDNSKIRDLVPGYEATVPFTEGIAQSIAWFDADPARQVVDEDEARLSDALAEIYGNALSQAAALRR